MSESAERKEKFTPGPWVVGSEGNGSCDYIYCDDVMGSAIATVRMEYTIIPYEQKVANAKLIAAAPDMYAALEELLDSESVSIFSSAMESDSWKLDLKEWEVRARSALAKARGETKGENA